MPVIRVTQFGGLMPSVSPRALPDAAAQVAENLLAGTLEFRPLQGAGTAEAQANGPISNPKTIYRYKQVDGTWWASSAELNIVRGQVADDADERTYVSWQDGSTAPHIFPAGRQLGVPSPGSAPTLAVLEAVQFSEAERAAGILAAGIQSRDGLHNNMSPAVSGGSLQASNLGFSPTMATSVPGYFSRSLDPSSGDLVLQMGRAFRATSTGGANNGGFETAYVDASIDTAENFAWAIDPALGGFWLTMPSGISIETSPWGTTYGCVAGDDHWCISFYYAARTYTLNRAAAEAALTAIDLPGGDPGDKFYTPAEVESICDVVESYLDPDGTIKPEFDTLAQQVGDLKGWLDGGGVAFRTKLVTDFYASTAVDTYLDDAIAAFAERIANAAIAVANTREIER